MKVWILNPFDNLPHEGYRPQRYWLLARAFARRGDEVTVFSSTFSHALKRQRSIESGVVREGIVLRLVQSPCYPRNVCIKRLYSHWRMSGNWLRMAEGMAPPGLVVVSSPPLTLVAAARKFCAKVGAKLVVDVQDAWPETF